MGILVICFLVMGGLVGLVVGCGGCCWLGFCCLGGCRNWLVWLWCCIGRCFVGRFLVGSWCGLWLIFRCRGVCSIGCCLVCVG